MSKLLYLDENNILESIPLMLSEYDEKIEYAKSIFLLDGKRIENVMRDLPFHQAEYSKLSSELKTLMEILDLYKDKINAKLWKKYLEGYPKALSTRDIQAYISGEPEIIAFQRIQLEVKLIRDNVFEIVEALKQMGWQCGNITKLMIADMREAIL